MRLRILLAVLLATSLVLVACGGGGGDVDGGSESAFQHPQDVKKATVRIQAGGSFVDPQVGQQLNVTGSGSGLIIDPSGIAVTNNHVVTGAAYLRVWVGGGSEVYNAKILGVSECSDLAVIDIDGEGFPYVEWYDGDISVGLDVYAAGYPLGDPEFTLTRGIVSKAKASGETTWASVDYVIEHDATINPGNSGGPLVDEHGKVIGVNYASASGTNQYFAIARDKALQVIEVLRQGEDLNSIGVNGQAINDGEGLCGVWVASVESGSPADNAGVEAGDIITKLEGLVLATDGSMADYCDILRTHHPTDTLDIEVLRYSTGELLEGQLNGRPLAVTFSFAQQYQESVSPGGSGSGSGGGQTGGGYIYVTVTDDTGALTMDIPSVWYEVDGSPWVEGGEVIGAAIQAAADLQSFNDSWSEPGVFLAASMALAQSTTVSEALDILKADFQYECDWQGRSDYQDPKFTGQYDYYVSCGGSGTHALVLAAQPQSGQYMILLAAGCASDADLEAMDRILDTFDVVGQLPA